MLRRYPVKSMLGEEVPASEVTASGLAGDRGLAVVSLRSGKVASAKYPRLWRDLLTLSAEVQAATSGSRCRTARPSPAATPTSTRSCPVCWTSRSR